LLLLLCVSLRLCARQCELLTRPPLVRRRQGRRPHTQQISRQQHLLRRAGVARRSASGEATSHEATGSCSGDCSGGSGPEGRCCERCEYVLLLSLVRCLARSRLRRRLYCMPAGARALARVRSKEVKVSAGIVSAVAVVAAIALSVTRPVAAAAVAVALVNACASAGTQAGRLSPSADAGS
jgi:hypothetical protein